MPHDELVRFAIDKGMDVEYVALGEQISSAPLSPTVFDVVGEIEVKRGETLFNLAQWERQSSGATTNLSYSGRATGYIRDSVFQGTFCATHRFRFPDVPDLELELQTVGTLNIQLEAR